MTWVQWLNGSFEGALHTMNAITEIPPMANRALASIHMCLGQQDEAREAVRRLLEYDPGYSIKDVCRNYRGKFRKESGFERLVKNLRDAGLPE